MWIATRWELVPTEECIDGIYFASIALSVISLVPAVSHVCFEQIMDWGRCVVGAALAPLAHLAPRRNVQIKARHSKSTSENHLELGIHFLAAPRPIHPGWIAGQDAWRALGACFSLIFSAQYLPCRLSIKARISPFPSEG